MPTYFQWKLDISFHFFFTFENLPYNLKGMVSLHTETELRLCIILRRFGWPEFAVGISVMDGVANSAK